MKVYLSCYEYGRYRETANYIICEKGVLQEITEVEFFWVNEVEMRLL